MGTKSHPAKLATAGTESCGQQGDLLVRSVDRKCEGRAIEPRNNQPWGPHCRGRRGQHRGAVSRIKRRGPGGVVEQGVRTMGFPRDLGGAAVSTLKVPVGAGRTTSGPFGRRVCAQGERSKDAGVVPRSEGNRAIGMAGSGRSTFIVPRKQGNLPEGSLRREGGCREVVRLEDPGGSMERGRER